MSCGFALFPLVAIFYQFGWKHSLIAAVVVLMARVLVVRYFPHLNPESIEIFIGMVMLLAIAITHDLRHRGDEEMDTSGLSVFEERTSRIIKNLPYIAIVGALIAAVASMNIFAYSEVSIFTLEKAYSAGVTPEESQTLLHQAALAEFMRGLGFVPMIATTALATGVYAVSRFYLCVFRGLSGAESVDCRHPGGGRDFCGSAAVALDWEVAWALPVGAQCVGQYP